MWPLPSMAPQLACRPAPGALHFSAPIALPWRQPPRIASSVINSAGGSPLQWAHVSGAVSCERMQPALKVAHESAWRDLALTFGMHGAMKALSFDFMRLVLGRQCCDPCRCLKQTGQVNPLHDVIYSSLLLVCCVVWMPDICLAQGVGRGQQGGASAAVHQRRAPDIQLRVQGSGCDGQPAPGARGHHSGGLRGARPALWLRVLVSRFHDPLLALNPRSLDMPAMKLHGNLQDSLSIPA